MPKKEKFRKTYISGKPIDIMVPSDRPTLNELCKNGVVARVNDKTHGDWLAEMIKQYHDVSKDTIDPISGLEVTFRNDSIARVKVSRIKGCEYHLLDVYGAKGRNCLLQMLCDISGARPAQLVLFADANMINEEFGTKDVQLISGIVCAAYYGATVYISITKYARYDSLTKYYEKRPIIDVEEFTVFGQSLVK